jgi:TolB-like protein/class 3 adenylate cyclase
MAGTRQLAAIMFTDIVGYTALMGEDEHKAFELLRQNRKVQQPLIEQYHGKWIKEIGDGVLASFPTVTDAVLSAGAIQHACFTVPGLQLRIGIHLGDIMFENNDIFGDGVNIASRLQALAPIGGIWISESVHRNIANKKGISSRFVGEETLKNVRDSVRIYEVEVEHHEWMHNDRPLEIVEFQKSIDEKSIAVLPFVNMSNDPEQDYFSDGIAEEILNSLAHVKDLKVAGRTSSFQFKGKNLDVRELGEKLGVRNIMEGSVRKHGNRLRITAQLISVKDGFHLWSEKYDRDIGDIFAIQDEIAFAVTEKLKVTLLENERQQISKNYTQNSEAYELYLKGRFYLNRRGNGIMRAAENFQESISVDSQYAPAYAGYADACLLSGFYSIKPAKEVMPKAKEAAETAIRLDVSLCEPYTSLGFYYAYFEWNWEAAKRNFLKSIELNPAYSTGHFWYGMLYLSWIEQDYKLALQHGSIAIKLEPLSAIAHALQVVNYYVAEQLPEAIKYAEKAIELDPNSYIAYRMITLIYAEMKMYDEAIGYLEHALQMSNRFQWSMFDQVMIYNACGDITKAQMAVEEIEQRSSTEYISPFHRALAAAWMNDYDLAIVYLEKAYDERDPILLTIKTWLNVPKQLLQDPRCQELIRRIEFPV